MVAAAAFAVVKAVFYVADWVIEKDGDKLLRRHLDAAWDNLNKQTLGQIANRLLEQVVERASEFLQPGKWPWGKLVAMLFLVNAAAYVIGQAVFCTLKEECGSTLGHDSVLQDYGFGRLFVWLALSFSASVFLQIACLSLVLGLFRLAVPKFGTLKLMGLIFLCAAFVIATFLAQYAAQQVATYLSFERGPYWDKFWTNISGTTPYFWATLILSIVAGFPLVAFLIVISASLVLRLLPSFARSAMIWLVWKITTDSSPVLERLAGR
jgi:hypothetical protein